MVRAGVALVIMCGATAIAGDRIMCGAPAIAGVPHDVRDVPLIDQRGAAFTLRALARPTAVIFVASRCTDACPIAEALFARLDAKLRRAHVDARLLTVTLEPDYDRPFVMARKARTFNADPARWRWASGDPAAVRRVLDAFNVPRLDGKFHGTFAYVLDARALPARLVLLSTAADDELLNDLRAAAARRTH
ncbi:MAG: SCO family protein [Candidatus Eremiobacteraeota bacterium]|nr:SCO family protein [Candidatus Eremiobacteraeota bacterium]